MPRAPARLRKPPDEAILRLARALAVQAAKEDHEKALAVKQSGRDDGQQS